MPAPDTLIDVVAVAARFGCHPKTIPLWAKKGIVPQPVVRRHRYARWSEIEINAAIEKIKTAEHKEEVN